MKNIYVLTHRCMNPKGKPYRCRKYYFASEKLALEFVNNNKKLFTPGDSVILRDRLFISDDKGCNVFSETRTLYPWETIETKAAVEAAFEIIEGQRAAESYKDEIELDADYYTNQYLYHYTSNKETFKSMKPKYKARLSVEELKAFNALASEYV